MSGNLGLPSADQGNWQLSINYDLNVLNTLKDGTTRLNDNTRKRTTHSLLTEIGYSITDKLSIDAFFSFVKQERKLSPVWQPENFTSTNGIGDAVLLLKYKFYKNFQAGIGVKLPLGLSDIRDERGLTLNADLQPGSGAWDIIYWFNGSHPIAIKPSMSLTARAIYRSTGENNTYFETQTYEFGNEFQFLVGLADRYTIGTQIFDPSLSFKYRAVSSDINDDFEVPSTGGQWVFIRPGLAYNLNPNLIIQSNIELPIYANLSGTQVTPTFRWNFGVLFKTS